MIQDQLGNTLALDQKVACVSRGQIVVGTVFRLIAEKRRRYRWAQNDPDIVARYRVHVRLSNGYRRYYDGKSVVALEALAQ